jgi:Secretion system C-terminal sorting domain
MRTLTTTLLTLLTLTLHAQFDFNRNGFLEPQFHFVMRFEDAKGNRDSVVFGLDDRLYDPNRIPESAFGEKIITTPYDSVFEVRQGVRGSRIAPASKIGIGAYHSSYCDPKFWTSVPFPPALVPIGIHAQHYPVKISWDSTLFNTTCFAKTSLFSNTTYRFVAKLRSQRSFILRENQFGRPAFTEKVLLQNGKTVDAMVMYLALESENIVPTHELAEEIPIRMYPNPVQDILQVQSPEHIQSLYISDALGHLMPIQEANYASGGLDISMLPEGVYFIKIISTDNRIHTQKICIAR